MKLYNYLYLIPILMVGYYANGTEQEVAPPAMAEDASYTVDNVADITNQDIDMLITYLPAIKFESHVWTEEDFLKEGKLKDFRQELLRKWVRPYDWQEWQIQAKAFQDEPELLRRASLAEIVKLITLHVRKDRNSEGHLLLVVRNGEMKNILNRLREIRVKEPMISSSL